MLSRRSFIGISSTALGVAYLGGNVTRDAIVEHIRIPVAALPLSLRSFNIAYLSDFHLGPWLTQEQCYELILPIKNLNPDLVLLGGDYILGVEGLIGGSIHSLIGRKDDRSPYTIYSEAVTLCRDLFKPQFGIFGVLGNHDNWAHPDLCKKAFNDAGASLLINENASIVVNDEFSLLITGTDDFWTGNPSMPPLSASMKHYKILLTHNPDGIQFLLNHGGRFDLALCGHTHGGQIKLPFLGSVLYNCRDSRFREGLFTGKDYLVYTSRGIGAVEIPLRINCPPELTLIELHSA